MANRAKPGSDQSAKPNIVFILVDNVGWGDFGVWMVFRVTIGRIKFNVAGIHSHRCR